MIDDIRRLSPVPIVALQNPSIPSDGLMIATSEFCRRQFGRGPKCSDHYQNLAMRKCTDFELVQCPYGFASVKTNIMGLPVAATSLLLRPGLGGTSEKARYKAERASIIHRDRIPDLIGGLRSIAENVVRVERDAASRFAVALHEIRKLNGQIKQVSESLCRAGANSSRVEDGPKDLVTIYKSAELMSHQFDIIELLANEDLATLPLKTRSHVYRTFDKCARILQARDPAAHIEIHQVGGYEEPYIWACDKTFTIIPTVLIGNALRYGKKGGTISIEVDLSNRSCTVRVSNITANGQILDNSVFERGVRGSHTVSGSGYGLYLAQLVARQHGTVITVESRCNSDGSIAHTFMVRFQLAE